LNELKNRGVEDILIANRRRPEGLSRGDWRGFPANDGADLHRPSPAPLYGVCLLEGPQGHASALKTVYYAVDDKAAEVALTAFEDSPLGKKYEAIGKSWRRAWQEVIPFFAFPREVRRILYTTNAIEALNSKLRRAVRDRGHFPNDEAAMKLLFLVLNRSEKEWKMPPREWAAAKAQMAVMVGERFSRAISA
jgi:putative transposase